MLLDRFGYARWEHTLAEHLSGGTRQKLNLSIALLHEPELVVLDEPYLAFDWESYLRFWDLQRSCGPPVGHWSSSRTWRTTRLASIGCSALREGVLQCA